MAVVFTDGLTEAFSDLREAINDQSAILAEGDAYAATLSKAQISAETWLKKRKEDKIRSKERNHKEHAAELPAEQIKEALFGAFATDGTQQQQQQCDDRTVNAIVGATLDNLAKQHGKSRKKNEPVAYSKGKPEVAEQTGKTSDTRPEPPRECGKTSDTRPEPPRECGICHGHCNTGQRHWEANCPLGSLYPEDRAAVLEVLSEADKSGGGGGKKVPYSGVTMIRPQDAESTLMLYPTGFDSKEQPMDYPVILDNGSSMMIANRPELVDVNTIRECPPVKGDTALGTGSIVISQFADSPIFGPNCEYNTNSPIGVLCESWVKFNYGYAEEYVPLGERRVPRWKKVYFPDLNQVVKFNYIPRKDDPQKGVWLADFGPIIRYNLRRKTLDHKPESESHAKTQITETTPEVTTTNEFNSISLTDLDESNGKSPINDDERSHTDCILPVETKVPESNGQLHSPQRDNFSPLSRSQSLPHGDATKHQHSCYGQPTNNVITIDVDGNNSDDSYQATVDLLPDPWPPPTIQQVFPDFTTRQYANPLGIQGLWSISTQITE